MDRTAYVNQITTQLGVLAERVKASSKNGRTDINVDSEMTVCGLINRLEGWDLENLNTRKANFPGIDLADWDRRIAVQVTATATGYKINHTLDEFLKNGFDDSFDRLIVVIITNDKLPDATARTRGDFRFDPKADIWNVSTLTGAVRNLPDAGRLEVVARFLEQELGTVTRRPKHLLPGVPNPTESFVEGSRDREVAAAVELLRAGKHVFLWGVGGIGKTEVAIQIAKRCAPPEGAWFLRYYYDMPGEGEALRETILRADFSGYRFEGPDNESRDREYGERMDILRREYAGALVIVDNFDRAGKTLAELKGERAYQELTAMGIRLVFTTRSRAEAGIEIKPLSEEMLLGLMRAHYRNAEVSDEQLLALIRAVDGHTLMVDLMAKTLQDSLREVTPARMLEALRKGALKGEKLPSLDKLQKGRNVKGTIADHLRVLFDLSAMNPAEKAVLRCATLLPEDGMDALLFKDCLRDEAVEIPRKWYEKLIGRKRQVIPSEREMFMRLTRTGWLSIDPETNLLTIHPVIREVCGEELERTDESCGDFLIRLRKRYDLDKEYDADNFFQIAKCFSVASDELPDRDGDFALWAGRFWNLLGQAQTALRYELRMVERCEANLPPDHQKLAAAYNNVGLTYDNLGDHGKALEYHQKALEIWEKALPADHPDRARSYNNVGLTYGNLGDHGKALEYHQKALGIWEKALPADHLSLATSYNNVGLTYNDLGDHGKALKYHQKALGIREKVLPAGHPDLATSCNCMGYTYDEMGDHGKALECHRKALEIREKVLPADHPDLATSFNNVGCTYGAMEDYPRALEYLEKALDIVERTLPADHLYIARTKGNIAWYREQLAGQETTAP